MCVCVWHFVECHSLIKLCHTWYYGCIKKESVLFVVNWVVNIFNYCFYEENEKQKLFLLLRNFSHPKAARKKMSNGLCIYFSK